MTRYAKLAKKPRRFHALTGYTLEEFHGLLPAFGNAFLTYVREHTLTGRKRKTRSYSCYKNCPLPTMEEKLLFIMMYLRKATTQDIFGEVFNMSQPVANQWIHLLHPCLNQALAAVGELPARDASAMQLESKAEQVYFHDGTERPIQRPKDEQAQKAHYSGKKKRHTVKNNLLVNSQGKIELLTKTCEGTKHDKKVADEAAFTLPPGSVLYQDTGFQGFSLPDVTIVQPKKKPRNGELTAEDKAANRQVSGIRIRVEHAICGVKRYRIVKDQLRARKDNFSDRVMETCCGLHNFRLNFRPWHYPTQPLKS